MFNRSLIIRILGNGYLALVGLTMLFAGFLSMVALVEVDEIGGITKQGLLHATYETLNCFESVFAAWSLTTILMVGGLGLLVVAVLRLNDNTYEIRFPRRMSAPEFVGLDQLNK